VRPRRRARRRDRARPRALGGGDHRHPRGPRRPRRGGDQGRGPPGREARPAGRGAQAAGRPRARAGGDLSVAAAGYWFLPWVRTGMAGEITRADETLTDAPRAAMPVTVAIDAAGDPRPVTAQLALYGPGEVTGIDPRVVIRQVPAPGEVDAEPSELPMVELRQPDFPWRYTPARDDARARVRPWLVLAVLTAAEITA